jgi:hypothetical protein
MKVNGRVLREYIRYPWHFNDGRPFKMAYQNGDDVTIESIDKDLDYEVISKGRSFHAGEEPFTRYTVIKAL